MEGTTLSRPIKKFQTEDELENQFIKTFKENKGINLVYVSGQNIDRLVTIFRACRRSRKLFVIDFYIATVLAELVELGGGLPYPSPNFPEVKVFFPNLLTRRMIKHNRNDLIDRFKDYEITFDEINANLHRIVMTVRPNMEQEIKKIKNLSGGNLVYSMWEGYKNKAYTERFLSSIVNRGATISTIHTSGHADFNTLEKLTNTIQAKELIPIHTTEATNYQEMFPQANVKQATDGEAIAIDDNKDQPKSTLLKHIEELGNSHQKSGIMPDTGFDAFIENNKIHFDFICKKLGLNEIQALLFSDMVNCFDGYYITLKIIADFIGCKQIKLINHIEDFKVLEDKNLIQIDESSDIEKFESSISFIISMRTLSALQKGNVPEPEKDLSIDDFFVHLAKIYENRVQKKTDFQRTLKMFNTLLRYNSHLNIVKKIKSYALLPDDEIILLRFCHYLVNLDEDSMNIQKLLALYNDSSDFQTAKRKLKSDNHTLQKKELIQNVNNEGFSDAETFCLTEKAKDELLSELKDQLSKKSLKGIKNAQDVPVKQLFYPEKTRSKITELTALLQEENFSSVQKRLSEENQRTGFACLFTGSHGTGKTETVYQIARQTSRGIMQVDISDTKSKWFGESETKIKKIFTDYRYAVKNSKIAPILLLNEADAIIGKRQNLGENRNGPGQTENAIQNIILQEIENLNGILIATTNLVQNMDKAFERRFLYKIEFEKPTLEVRKSIWQSLISDLTDEEANTLATQFNFSGGQIENISRRCTVAKVLYGSLPSLETLLVYCKDEVSEDESKKIGF